MKYQLSFVALFAYAAAVQGIHGEGRTKEKRLNADLYSVPAPGSVYAGPPPSSAVDKPTEPTDIGSDDSCSTALTTITTTRTVSVITQIPSSLASVTGTVDLSSFGPSQSAPTTGVTGVIELSTWLAPQPPSGTATDFVPVPSSVASDGEESSVEPPYAPAPTASIEPTETSSDGTTSSTSTSSDLPVFTDAAGVVGVPVVVVGVFGLAALVL